MRPLLLTFLAAALLTASSLPKPIQELVDRDQWKRARSIAATQLKQNPKDPKLLLSMSVIEESFNNLAKARAHAEQAIALAPQDAAAHAQLARVCAQMAQHGPFYKQLNFVRIMKRELEATYRIDPNNLEALLTDMLFSYKAPAIVGGNKAKAQEIAKRIGQHHPEWANLVIAKLGQQDLHEATVVNALRKEPNNFVAQANLGLVLCCHVPNPRLDEAATIARMLIRKEPSRVAGYEILARIHAAEAAIPELEATLAEAARNVPEDLSPHYWAAKTLIEKKRERQRAEAYLRRYLSQEPEGRAPTTAEAMELLKQLGR